MPNTYQSESAVNEAMQWTGTNIEELWEWVSAEFLYGSVHDYPARLYVAENDKWVDLEIGEWIVKGEAGFYSCKDSEFQEKYELVADA